MFTYVCFSEYLYANEHVCVCSYANCILVPLYTQLRTETGIVISFILHYSVVLSCKISECICKMCRTHIYTHRGTTYVRKYGDKFCLSTFLHLLKAKQIKSKKTKLLPYTQVTCWLTQECILYSLF